VRIVVRDLELLSAVSADVDDLDGADLVGADAVLAEVAPARLARVEHEQTRCDRDELGAAWQRAPPKRVKLRSRLVPAILEVHEHALATQLAAALDHLVDG
jgi:hypothetical protein